MILKRQNDQGERKCSRKLGQMSSDVKVKHLQGYVFCNHPWLYRECECLTGLRRVYKRSEKRKGGDRGALMEA